INSYESYVKIASMLKDRYIAEGMKEKDAEKKAIEDARYVLPNACETKMVFTMNARTLLNFIKHRDCERAQWEIREMTELMVKELMKISPKLFSKCGASCRYGKCGEGNMSCGHPKPRWEDVGN
ncbi:FAD-dependent thymidylate synthase, partial [Clostridium sp.]|uniref:FAD-dependent thymidylate synthase n=1 Tax=Clostridium sp. TaxID=1506 RepID=UPI003F34F3E1